MTTEVTVVPGLTRHPSPCPRYHGLRVKPAMTTEVKVMPAVTTEVTVMPATTTEVTVMPGLTP